jgi:hypothetical protein
LENVQESGVGGKIGNTMTKGAAGLLNKGANIREAEQAAKEPANITVCGSGNLAQVYFDLFPRKVTLNELNTAYPGMVEAVVAHPGVGFVVTYNDDMTPLVLGKRGQRDLHTSAVSGEDPLAAYGEADFRAAQVRRVADFPHNGDLLVISTLYPDGTVAAMEELIGNHGGLGGEQTDAFILHAMDMPVPETANSADVFAILNNRRGLPGLPAVPEKPVVEVVDAWALGNLLKGLRRVKPWIKLALGALMLQRSAYRQIASQDSMTGPALLLGILGTAIFSISLSTDFSWVLGSCQIIAWFVTVLIMYLAGRLLRGNGTYSSVLRTMGFAQGIYLLNLFSFIPSITPIVRFIVSLLVFIGVWTGVATAHNLKGWRSLILPIIYVLVFLLGFVIIYTVIGGLNLTLESLAIDIGLR